MPIEPPRFPLPPTRFTGAARVVPLLRAFDWIGEGWALFLGAPRVWLFLAGGILFIFAATEFVWLYVQAGFSPSLPRSVVLGLLFFSPVVLMPLGVAAGLHLCRLLARGETPELEDLGAGLALAPRPLLLAGAITLAGWLLIYALHQIIQGPLSLFLPTLAGFAFLIAIWFVPPLVAFHDQSPLLALGHGFAACTRSAGTFAVFGLTMALLHLLALLPAGLGLIVLLPVVIGALHASYRDVFIES